MDPKRAHYNLTFAILAISGIAFALLQSLVAPALRTIQTDLHTTTTTVAWVFTGYLLSASVATPIVGRLGDMFGKKRMLVVTLAIVAAGTLVAALATSIDVLILGRVIQGAGGAIFPLAFAIIRDEFPHERVPTGIALISALLGVGGGLGIVLAGPITQHLSYHWLFWLPLVPVVAAGGAAQVVIPGSPIRAAGFGASVTQAGIFLLPATLGMLLVGPLSGRLVRSLGAKVPLVAGCLLTAASYTFVAAAHDARWEIYVCTSLMGAGIGFAFGAMANLIVAAVRAEETGVATGMNTIVRTIGGSLGSQISASVVAASTDSAYTTAFAIAAAAVTVSFLVSFSVPGRARSLSPALVRSPS